MNQHDRYQWWRDVVADPASLGGKNKMNPNEPQCGYYRTRRGDACAIWIEGGKMFALEGKRAVDAEDLWSWCGQFPVSYEAYKEKIDTGRWPDDPPVIETRRTDIAAPAPAGIGHNMPPPGFETFRTMAIAEIEMANALFKNKFDSKEDADKAGAWRDRVRKLASKGEKMRKAEKDPHYQAGLAVDAKWNAVIDELKEVVARMAKPLQAWLDEQDRLENERQRKAREEADRQWREMHEADLRAREAARAIEEADVSKPLDAGAIEEAERAAEEAKRQAEALREAEREAQARKVHAGRTGAKAILKEYAVGKITNRAAFLEAVKDEPEVSDALEAVCRRLTRLAAPVAGMEITREKRVV